MTKLRIPFLYLSISFLTMGLFVVSLSVGGSHYGMNELLLWLSDASTDTSIQYIFESLRLPRTFAAFLVGGALGLSGLLLQTTLQNPLAEPYTLGLSGGATLGAVVVLILNPTSWLTVPMGALLGCLAVTTLLLITLSKKIFFSQKSLILIGVMISLFCGSVVTVLLTVMSPDKVQSAMTWMIGSVGSTRDHWWHLLGLQLLLVLTWALFNYKNLDRLHLGDEMAITLGTRIALIKKLLILFAASLTAGAVAISGLVGFVGLLAPHFSSYLTRTVSHKHNILLSVLSGGNFLLMADVLARILFKSQEVPAGSIVALLGAPVFIALIVKGSHHA